MSHPRPFRFGAEAIASRSADAADEQLCWVRATAGDRFDDGEISVPETGT